MPTATFTIDVLIPNCSDSEMAALKAGRYLAYSDQTDTFGYHSNIISMGITRRMNEGWLVGIEFSSVVTSYDDIENFLRETDHLAKVRDAECTSNPMDARL